VVDLVEDDADVTGTDAAPCGEGDDEENDGGDACHGKAEEAGDGDLRIGEMVGHGVCFY